jgi:hypothetical protein
MVTPVKSLLGLGIFILISWGLIVWVVVFAASEDLTPPPLFIIEV